MSDGVTRILLAALGGEGGGVLMNWIVAAGRNAGHRVQATSVPGVAQRTGSTSYNIEVASKEVPDAVLGLVPLKGRVDVLVSSELLETARVISAGFVSPKRTTVISSTARFYSTAEKISMGDGRYSQDNVRAAVETMAKDSYLLDLSALATENKTFVSATMFGALANSGVLPWDAKVSRAVLGDDRSRAGFDAAAKAVEALRGKALGTPDPDASVAPTAPARSDLPEQVASVLSHGLDRMVDYLDEDYASLFKQRAQRLIAATHLEDHRSVHALTEAVRRLALWMAYEDIPRVADLKSRKERFDRIRDEVQLESGQILTVTEYMKPRAEEIADILPISIGQRMMARAQRGGWFPFLGKGRYIRSNGIIGYRLLRTAASLKRIRRKSLRYHEEQAAIEIWLSAMETALKASSGFAMGLAELPRVLKGYSDTLLRGKSAYSKIWESVVAPAIAAKTEDQAADKLRAAIGAALADEDHEKLDDLLDDRAPQPPILKQSVRVASSA